MKITNIDIIHINPLLVARYAGREVDFAGIDTQTIFRVTTDNGIVGHGDSRGHVSSLNSDIDKMIDRSPADFLASDLATGFVGAIYDVIGRKVRDRVPVAAWTRPAASEDFALELQRAMDAQEVQPAPNGNAAAPSIAHASEPLCRPTSLHSSCNGRRSPSPSHSFPVCLRANPSSGPTPVKSCR